ncbi:MAG: glycosyltransferase [Paracoccaceae bacterium]
MAELDRLGADLDEDIVAQVGPDTTPRQCLKTHATLTPDAFDALFRQARVVVAHAGIGSILSAKAYRKPLIVMPRRLAHAEHRNDHQLATARQVEAVTGIHVAWDISDLAALLSAPSLTPAVPDPGATADQLRDRIRDFIDQG